jgi:thiol:disulfide interchange protein DsbD
MGFRLQDTNGVQLGTPALPPGEVKEDEFLGRTQVYHQDIEARIPLVRGTSASQPVTLEITYQGCAEAGLCYPPITKPVALMLPLPRPRGPVESQAQPRLVQAPIQAPGREAAPRGAGSARKIARRSTGSLLSFFGFGPLSPSPASSRIPILSASSGR